MHTDKSEENRKICGFLPITSTHYHHHHHHHTAAVWIRKQFTQKSSQKNPQNKIKLCVSFRRLLDRHFYSISFIATEEQKQPANIQFIRFIFITSAYWDRENWRGACKLDCTYIVVFVNVICGSFVLDFVCMTNSLSIELREKIAEQNIVEHCQCMAKEGNHWKLPKQFKEWPIINI